MTKPTENELFEITNFEKWFKESRYNDEYYDIALSGWNVRAELADKEIAELQAQILELKGLLNEARDDVAAQLDNYQQLLPYKQHRYDAQKITLDSIDEALAKTAPQCLQEFQNEVIERCAKVCDEMVDWPLAKHPCATINSNEYLIGIRRGLVNATNSIRALKGKQNEP